MLRSPAGLRNETFAHWMTTYAVLVLSALAFDGCADLAVHDTSSLLLPQLHRSEVFGFIAGLGTTFAAVPDVIRTFRERPSKNVNPTMAGIMGAFQILWIYYGVLIESRPVIIWNTIGVMVNFLSVVAFRHFARTNSHRRRSETLRDPLTP